MDKERSGERMRLGAFFHPTGNHVAAWLHPDAQIDAGSNFRHYAEITQTAERGKFDLMFVADAVAVRDGNLSALSRWPQYMVYFDPLTLLPAIAAVTKHIGVVATATTSYNEPYHIARKFASLDHISGGRAGWNVVTSSAVNEAQNFGREQHYEHGERYDRANEFVEVVKGLWDSWEDDAFIRDRSTGRYFDPTKLHALNHKGKNFSVRGPLNVARPPQGHPVLFQAGSSEAGRESAARFAEGVFTPQHTLAGAQEFYRDLKGRMARYGRPPEALKIMPGLNAIVGRTAKEAEEKHRFLQSKIHPDVGLELLSNQLDNMDLSEYDLDGPLPDIPDQVAALAGQTSMRNIVGVDHPADLRAVCWRARPADADRVADRHCRRHGKMVPQLRGRRLPCAPAISAGRAQRFCRSGNPGTTEPRAVPHRIRGRDLARKPGPETAAEPLHDRYHLTTEPTSELAQHLAQRAAGIGLACQPAALQGRHQPFADFVDNAAADALERRADQEPVAADCLDRCRHAISDLVRRADQVEPAIEAFGSELPQSLAAAPLRKLVERTLFAIGCDPWQRRIEIELREVDIGYRADRRQRRLDKARRGDHAAVLGACLLTCLAEDRID